MTKKIMMNKKDTCRSRKAVIKAIELIGDGVRLAKLLGIKSQNIYSWKTDPSNKSFSYIPVYHALSIEKITNKEIKKEDLRPDIFNQN